METHNLSEYDRSLIVGLTDAVRGLAAAMNGNKTERLYSCREAALLLGKAPQTVSRYIRQGRIKKAVRGGVVGIPESEIKKFNLIKTI